MVNLHGARGPGNRPSPPRHGRPCHTPIVPRQLTTWSEVHAQGRSHKRTCRSTIQLCAFERLPFVWTRKGFCLRRTSRSWSGRVPASYCVPSDPAFASLVQHAFVRSIPRFEGEALGRNLLPYKILTVTESGDRSLVSFRPTGFPWST
eukprot:scaffold1146_cov339-Pavlova_lutheri.AAC.16